MRWGPYLSFGRDPSTTMVASWRSREAAVGPKTSSTGSKAWLEYWEYGLGETASITRVEATLGRLAGLHITRMENLVPGTVYSYRTSTCPDETHTFKTAPVPGTNTPFEFTLVGDMHARPCNDISKYFSLMSELAPGHDFFAGLGDFINDGDDPADWDAYFRDGAGYLPCHPQMNVPGNHDAGSPSKYQRYTSTWMHPYVDENKGGYYLMEYANAVIFFIDSTNAGGWQPTPGDTQYDWLERNLERYALADRWIFLLMHHQVYSTGDFGCARLMHEVYRPLCQEYHVDAVFYGHDHHYEAFWVDRDASWGGTLFIVAGAGGGQGHVDHGIMGDRNGETKYIWPGRFLNVRKHGVPPETGNITPAARAFRNNSLVEATQLLGVLEPSFIHARVEGDVMDLKCMGWQRQVYHHLQVKRAGSGRAFHTSSEKVLLDY